MSTPLFDDNSPYASLRTQDANGYLRATVRGHGIADKNGKVRLHRAVHFDAIGDGSHRCDYCGIGGLRWDVPTSDVNYLTVDHANHVKTDCRSENLRSAHKYCNDNRAVIERLGIPWETIAAIPLGDRLNLRGRGGEPTAAALALAAPATSPAGTAATVPADEGVEVSACTSAPAPLELSAGHPPTAEPSAGEHRMYRWDDFCDIGELAKGVVHLLGPPEWLLQKYPALRKVDFSRFNR